MITVRVGREDDAGTVAALVDQLGYEPGPDLDERLARFAAAELDHVLVAEDDTTGEVLGFVVVSLTPMFVTRGWFSRITALCVGADARRSGVGAALVAAAEQLATEHGSDLMQLNCGRREERAAAHRFYPSLGYRDQHDHHVLYEKPLSPRPGT